jgi:hypothetical protein
MTPFRGLTRFFSPNITTARTEPFFQHVVSFPSRSITIETPYLSGGTIIPSCASIAGYRSSLPIANFLDLNFPKTTPCPKKTLQNSNLPSLTRLASQAALLQFKDSSPSSTYTMHQVNGTNGTNSTNGSTFLFTSESVGEGHPDKIADQV